LRLIDFVYHSTLGLRVIKKNYNTNNLLLLVWPCCVVSFVAKIEYSPGCDCRRVSYESFWARTLLLKLLNENYYTIALMLLVKIVMCSKFYCRNVLN